MRLPIRPARLACLARVAVAVAGAAVLGGGAAAATLQVQVRGAGGQPLADAVLLLEPQGGTKPALKPAANVEIAQKGRRFVPTVTVVPVGTKVQFPNQDTVRHHVYSFSPAKKFELKLYAGRPENPVEFDRPGVVVLGCNIHDTMVGWVIVADTPWTATTPAGGRATLAEVPPGPYLLRTWHPDLPAGSPGSEQAVTVGSADLELVATVPVK
ncbi:methylamine utilization protein [Ideonella sp.]|uniref:methylamine utilization protein n=1 Tax=Ideonella sp. TaxID=1929293 RepID=UPI002B47AB65|nr:methylamine utilization protein [Ideonella sp.]HJV68195.1 methylamine utilization protein [Ideonella sp.]